jgi:magnesium transporter
MLINRAAYRHGRKILDPDPAAGGGIEADPDSFVWITLHDPSEQELAALQVEFGLPGLAVEDALHGHQRPKVEEYNECLFVIVHTLEADAESDIRVGELAIFAGRNFVLAVWRGEDLRFPAIRARAEREPGLLRIGAGYVLYAILDSVVDEYFPIVDRLEAEIDVLEDEIFGPAGPGRDNIKKLYLLKQKAARLKHAVAPLLNDLGKLHGGRVPVQVSDVQDYIRDVADHLERINSSVDGLRDTIGTAVQVNLSLVTIRDGDVMKCLAAWGSIFAVWTSFSGLWGMNFAFMPELQWTYGYPIAMLVIVASCALLYGRFRRIGWL